MDKQRAAGLVLAICICGHSEDDHRYINWTLPQPCLHQLTVPGKYYGTLCICEDFEDELGYKRPGNSEGSEKPN